MDFFPTKIFIFSVSILERRCFFLRILERRNQAHHLHFYILVILAIVTRTLALTKWYNIFVKGCHCCTQYLGISDYSCVFENINMNIKHHIQAWKDCYLTSDLNWTAPPKNLILRKTYRRIYKYLRAGFVLQCMLVTRIHRVGSFPQKDADIICDKETGEDSSPDPNFRIAFCPLAYSVRRDFKTLCRSQVWAIWLIVQCTSIVANNITTTYLQFYFYLYLHYAVQ